MPEKTKPDEINNETDRQSGEHPPPPAVNPPDGEEIASWARDQREKEYYYDDAHGYEIYNPDEEDDDENEI